VRDASDDAAHGNQPALLALAKHPNVAVKCTGAARRIRASPTPTATSINTPRQIVETFGPQRSFWGTDITRMPCSWKECVTMFTEEMPVLKGHDLELVIGSCGLRLAQLEAAGLTGRMGARFWGAIDPGSFICRVLRKDR